MNEIYKVCKRKVNILKICKIKYVLFYCKLRETNLSFTLINLSCVK